MGNIRFTSNQRWVLMAFFITLLSLGVIFSGSPAQAAPAHPPTDGTVAASLPAPGIRGVGDQQIFNQDFTVESGTRVNENIAVFRGNVMIEEGASLRGDLSVFGGDVTILGELTGNLAVVGGDVDLRSTARVMGDISAIGGRIERAQGAFVVGNIVSGPSSGFSMPNLDGSRNGLSGMEARSSQSSSFLNFIWRLIRAFLLTLLFTGLATLVYWLFPKPVDNISAVLDENFALSFAVGLVAMVAVLGLSFIFGITIILICLSVLLIAGLAAVGLTGFTASSVWLARRIGQAWPEQNRFGLHPILPVTASAFVLSGLVFLDWAISVCLGIIVGLVVFSPGVGAILVHQSRRYGRGRGTTPPTPPAPPAPPLLPQPVSAPPADRADAAAEPGPDAESGAESGGAADDFTRLHGIGPAFQKRLHAAGILTFAQLAALTPDEIGEIIGWPAERVIQDQLREQAAALAGV